MARLCGEAEAGTGLPQDVASRERLMAVVAEHDSKLNAQRTY